MDLSKLFSIQQVLRNRIDYNQPDRFNKLVLALLVELGECANEWRGFKFWSQDQEPRIKRPIYKKVFIWFKKITGYKNQLLEEYVDGLHFLLELGLEINFTDIAIDSDYTKQTATETFIEIFTLVGEFQAGVDFDYRPEYKDAYEMLFNLYVGLAEKHFGFTWEQIEQAYIEKNKINHQRQDSGY